MVRTILAVAAILAALLSSSPAFARGGSRYGCPPVRWCGCYLRGYLHISDDPHRLLYRAFEWLKRGSSIPGPAVGAIAVFSHSHVGIVREVGSDGRIRVLSGNDGGQVRDRWRSPRGVRYRLL